MDITKQVDILSKGRTLMLKLIGDFSLEQINKIPEGFSNNIGWNVAHLVVTQQLLCYKFSGLKTALSDEMIGRYVKGTAPNGHIINQEEWELIKKLFVELPEKLLVDYNDKIFKTYSEYTTSVNVTLDSVEKAIDFNNFHEGIHLGVILGLRKLV
ncbi:damage-inducible protein DinB [Wenyingzhuangia fucanilytica]|uniref:Damage-inducible protein DinB n=1 Tax=Wenyingzhuangia fucanilytica TaxID=1790137 RepID=A0A1B1Y217_9FLAO|nr:DinB family protein [Wenyingzhuangia fucanilytica]ANW94811.1 damage-inducible protein DinB [Wenyingzhuangia fucanilytica]